MRTRAWIVQTMLCALVVVLAGEWRATAQTGAPALATPPMRSEVFNYGTWETGVMFSQGVSVTNPGRWLFLSGVGAEEDKPMGGVLHHGDFLAQCRHAYEQIRSRLQRQGAGIQDIVRTTTYVTDVRFLAANRACRKEVFGNGPYPPQTFLVVTALALQGMLVEIEVTAIAAK